MKTSPVKKPVADMTPDMTSYMTSNATATSKPVPPVVPDPTIAPSATASLPKVNSPQHLLYTIAVSAYLNNDIRAVSLFLQNPLVTAAEKALIRARKEMKMGRYEDARELLKIPTDSDLLKAERHFLLAGLHAHGSQWEDAVQDALTSSHHYLLCNNERGLFLSHYNLSVYYNRMGLDSMSLRHVEEAGKYAKTPSHRCLLHRARAADHFRHERYHEMLEEIDFAMSLRNQLDEGERATLDAIAADLYFRGQQLEKAKQILESLTNCKVARDKARVRFDLIVLTALLEKRSQFVQGDPPPVINENLEYKVRWKILLSLQKGDRAQAELRWLELQKHFPLRYTTRFENLLETDERTIFMTALRELLMNV